MKYIKSAIYVAFGIGTLVVFFPYEVRALGLMNAGQAVFFGSTALVFYALVVTLGFHAFVVLYEEPTLRKHYGERYREYCRRVPRWFPRVEVPELPQ